MSTLEILKAARELIADQEHWTQSAAARTNNDELCTVSSPKAYKFCAAGALHRAGAEGHWDDIEAVLIDDVDTLPYFNDSHTHEEVLELFDRAIQRLENEA